MPHLGKQALWFLGRAAVPYVEHTTGDRLYEGQHYIGRADQVAEGQLVHDLRSNEAFVSLARASRRHGGSVSVSGRDLVVSALGPSWVHNWMGPRHLAMNFYDRSEAAHRTIKPDGFAVLDLHRSAWDEDALPAGQLPFFIEYDRGTRKRTDVAEQLFAYHRLAVSGAPRKRFPDLDAKGYAIPVIMVLRQSARVAQVHAAFRAYADVRGVERGAPILLVAEEDWARDPLGATCVYAWEHAPVERTIGDVLLRASLPLLRDLRLHPGRALAVDAAAAKAVAAGRLSSPARARGRDELARRHRARESRT